MMGDLSVKEKKMVMVGVSAIGAVLLISSLTSSKKSSSTFLSGTGIEIADQCNSYKITDTDLFTRSIRTIIKADTRHGVVDPFQVARKFLKKAAPKCSFYPSNTRNPGEASLFVRVLDEVLDVMKEENLLSVQQQSMFRGMLEVWATAQGVPANEL